MTTSSPYMTELHVNDSFRLTPVDIARGELKPGNGPSLRAVGCVIAHGGVAGPRNSLETALLEEALLPCSFLCSEPLAR